MTTLISLGVIISLVFGFGLSGLLVRSKLGSRHVIVKALAFLSLGSIFTVFMMALSIFIVWPA